jgi:hypothetical protein
MSEKLEIPSTVLLNGFETFTATHFGGRKEEVQIRLVPLREVDEYNNIIGDQPAFVEFICKKDKGWADSLTFESLDHIDNTARAYNDPTIARWIVRSKLVASGLKATAQAVAEVMQLRNSLLTQ